MLWRQEERIPPLRGVREGEVSPSYGDGGVKIHEHDPSGPSGHLPIADSAMGRGRLERSDRLPIRPEPPP